VRRRLPTALLTCLMLLPVAACGSSSDDTAKAGASVDTGDAIKGLKVSGKFGADPVLKVDPAVTASKPETEVITAGKGDPVQSGKKAMFNIYLAKGSDGTKLYSDVERGTPQQVTMADDQFFKVIIKGLVGKPQGSRVAIAATVADVWGAAGAPQLKLKKTDTVVFVLDVLSVEPSTVLDAPKGKTVAAPAGAPSVKESGGKVTGIDFSKAPKKPPTKLQVIPLVQGTGPTVPAGRLVTFNYYGAVWGSKKPFDSSFSRGAPTPFGVGVHGLIPAWDQAIPGLKVGSRVLIEAPAKYAYGDKAQASIPKNSTLVFVVDVLGADS
jgi:peptidylprolyl isomerase